MDIVAINIEPIQKFKQFASTCEDILSLEIPNILKNKEKRDEIQTLIAESFFRKAE